MAHDLVGSNNALISGAILASFAVVSAVVTAIGSKLSPRLALFGGVGAMTLGVALLWLAVQHRSLVFLLAATSLIGVGYALLFLCAFTLINASAPASQRGGVLSALYLAGYLSMGSFALALGAAARAWGLTIAVGAGSITLVVLGLAALIFAIVHSPRALLPKEE